MGTELRLRRQTNHEAVLIRDFECGQIRLTFNPAHGNILSKPWKECFQRSLLTASGIVSKKGPSNETQIPVVYLSDS